MPDAMESDRPPGLVYTFYSYKGGVGRSMALANVGVLMAMEGRRVLLVDWDLEAPGLERYFDKAATIVQDPKETPGIVDLLLGHGLSNPHKWTDCLLRTEFSGCSLDIISSGRRDDDYRKKVQSLNWETLFEERHIGDYIDALRDEWRRDYDFVLVDSRTGITDIGDICTVILPDVLVFLFVTNHQCVEGTKHVMERAVKARSKMPRNRNKLLGVPVPARDERDKEYDKSIEWQHIFSRQFGSIFREWLPKEIRPLDALNQLFIPYVASWSFGEHLPVVESERERMDPTSLGAAYIRLAALLSNRLDWSAVDGPASTAALIGAKFKLYETRLIAEEAIAGRSEAEKVIERQRLLESDNEVRGVLGRLEKAIPLSTLAILVALYLLVDYIGSPFTTPIKSMTLFTICIIGGITTRNIYRNMQDSTDLVSAGWRWNSRYDSLEVPPALAGSLVVLSKSHILGLRPRALLLQKCVLLEDLSALSEIRSLEILDLSGCIAISDIKPIEKLLRLQYLDLSGCRAVQNIDAIGGLDRLTHLYLANCLQLRQPDVLNRLSGLKHLDLTGCTSLTGEYLEKLQADLNETVITLPDGSITRAVRRASVPVST